MLSEKSTEVVRATLPVVGGAIEEITGRFYGRLFAAHPELLRDLFNRGNQANGSQRQALAASIAAFASALVADPERRPDTMLARIAHKHASLGITADQYPIVHEHLFAAIVEVLGDAVTPEVAAAWDEVYWLMANALIAIEQGLYRQAGVADGEVWRRWRVAARQSETPSVTTFVVRPADGGPVPAARAGQYVSVRVPLEDGARQIRQYSLSGWPEGGLQFTVKRDGEVSAWLQDRLTAGQEIELSAPFGDIVLDENGTGGADAAGAVGRPVVLASAGIGCTPMVGMLEQLAGTGTRRPVLVVHGDEDPESHAFREEVARLVEKLADGRLEVWYRAGAEGVGARSGFVDLSQVAVPSDSVVYLCGPVPFMRAVRGQLLEAGVSPADIHYEVFGPDAEALGAA
ncbi:globin domain-containing protein [Phaeacidiphilus oryzae]|uniref:globin domain-containing protein n=1 Tax=Phaeacidiphilus oryzae TaxID=348818 RepID=UPI00055A19B1|nr:globin domain-containing protein [Phaeacidiphilus oryzae]